MATTILPSNSLESAAVVANPSKKGGGGRRKALKDLSSSELNAASPAMPEPRKEKKDGSSLLLSPSKDNSKDKPAPNAKVGKKKPSSDSAADVTVLQAMLEKLRLEKVEMEEQVRERDELLRRKEEEIEERGKEQEKLRQEMKKLQKVKGFNPILNIPVIQSLKKDESKAEDDSKRKKRRNKKKDEQKETIKKPCPAYVMYCKENWAQVKEANPQAAFRDVAAEVGAKWKGLGVEERKPFEERYQQEKEAYLKAVGREKREKEAMRLLEEEQMQKTAMELLQQYLQFRQEGDKESESSKPQKEKDPLKPKQSMTAFFHYLSDRRAALLGEGKGVLDVAKIAAEEWKNMGKDKRAPYEEVARQQKVDYLRQMELYKKRKAEETERLHKEEEEQKKIQKQEALQLLKKKEKADHIVKKSKEERKNRKNQNGEKKNVDPNKPKKPASSFLLFSKEQRKILMEEKSEMQTSTLNALISVRWKELAEEERQVWSHKAAEAMDAYKKEMDAYNNSVATATQ